MTIQAIYVNFTGEQRDDIHTSVAKQSISSFVKGFYQHLKKHDILLVEECGINVGRICVVEDEEDVAEYEVEATAHFIAPKAMDLKTLHKTLSAIGADYYLEVEDIVEIDIEEYEDSPAFRLLFACTTLLEQRKLMKQRMDDALENKNETVFFESYNSYKEITEQVEKLKKSESVQLA